MGEILPPERIAVINRGGGTLEWTVESSADWVEAVAEETGVMLHLTPPLGPSRANVYVRDRLSGALKTIRVSVRVRPAPAAAEPAVVEPAVVEPAVVEPAVVSLSCRRRSPSRRREPLPVVAAVAPVVASTLIDTPPSTRRPSIVPARDGRGRAGRRAGRHAGRHLRLQRQLRHG